MDFHIINDVLLNVMNNVLLEVTQLQKALAAIFPPMLLNFFYFMLLRIHIS
jgi:hypothetical protein